MIEDIMIIVTSFIHQLLLLRYLIYRPGWYQLQLEHISYHIGTVVDTGNSFESRFPLIFQSKNGQNILHWNFI